MTATVLAQEPFSAKQFPTGPLPHLILTTDIDNDGHADLLVPNKAATYVSRLLGDGLGNFSTGAPIVLAGSQGTTMAYRDFTGDGLDDVVVNTVNLLNIVKATGGGNFGAPAIIAAGGTAVSVMVANVNNDANMDLIVANDTGSLAVHLGIGGGNFAAPLGSLLALEPSFHQSMAGADFNADGIHDVAVTSAFANTVKVAYGNGSGAFGFPSTMGVPSSPVAVIVGDLNVDGFLDVISCSRTPSHALSVNYNNTVGGFLPALSYPAGPEPRNVVLDDMDADGNPDAVVDNHDYNDNGVSVLLGDGALGFGAPVKYRLGHQPIFALTADVNEDGIRDIVGLNYSNSTVSVGIGDGFGGVYTSRTVPTGDAPRSLTLADVNHDGVVDATTANSSMYAISTCLGNGDHSFAAPVSFPLTAPPQNVAVADVNGDWNLDYVTVTTSPARMTVYSGNGIGGFNGGLTYNLPSSGKFVNLADVNADGRPDAVMVMNLANVVYIMHGQPSGLFSVGVFFPTGVGPLTLALGDMNGDGIGDIVTGNSGSVSVLLATAPSVYAAPVSTPLTGVANSVVLGDLNLDGRLDVAFSDNSTNKIGVVLNQGAGVLGTPALMTTGMTTFTKSGYVAAGDINLDGKPDLLCVNSHDFDSNVTVLLGDGAGTFATPSSYGTDASSVSVQLADTDLDGDLDALATVEAFDRIAIAVNQSGNATNVVHYGTGTYGCRGRLGMGTNSLPHVNNAAFAIVASNGPKNVLGVLLLGDAPDLNGSDPFGLNLELHVDPFVSTFLFGYDVILNNQGATSLPVAIPNNPALANLTFCAQIITLENAADGNNCSLPSFSLVSTMGLTLTVAP